MCAIDAKTEIDGVDHWADYPGLAVDEEAVYVTANMFEYAEAGGSPITSMPAHVFGVAPAGLGDLRVEIVDDPCG